MCNLMRRAMASVTKARMNATNIVIATVQTELKSTEIGKINQNI